MTEPMAMSQPVVPGGPSSSGCFYNGNDGDEKYKLKMVYLSDKFGIVEDMNYKIRNRIVQINKNIHQVTKEKNAITAVLISYGDNPFENTSIKLNGNTDDPELDWSAEKDLALMREQNPDGTAKKRRPSGKSKSKAARAKAKLDEAEKKEEEQQTLNKIVSIISSVKTETARKTAKIEQEMKDRVASMTKNVTNNVQSVVDRVAMPPPSRVPPPRNNGSRSRARAAPAQTAIHVNQNNQMIHAAPSNRAIPYKIYKSPLKNEIEAQAEHHVEGQLGSIRFSYTPHDSKDLYIPQPHQIQQLTSGFHEPMNLQPMESYQETFSLDPTIYPDQLTFMHHL